MGVGVDDDLAPNRQQIIIRISTDQIMLICVCLNTFNTFMIMASCLAECRYVMVVLIFIS